ncbi:MAG: DUF262 domain-containing protein [Nitrospirae bacterium]|nr:DUF262 domain-containing protein [Nitrospirota bacterium]
METFDIDDQLNVYNKYSESEGVIDDTDNNDDEIPFKYEITSYGADYPVESIVPKLENESIVIPYFQRGYVWTHVDASRFIETLLLGLPVPGIFLSKEKEPIKYLVIDGQQRLRTLQYFYDGIFRTGTKKGNAFALKNVQEKYNKKTYKTLEPDDKTRLNNSLIHATIIQQDNPKDDDSSIYYIFERLNKFGRQLYPQEIRNCVYRGEFNELLKQLNTNEAWREIYGKESPRQKDIELILRFFALFYNSDEYRRPMKDFLNHCMSKYRNLTSPHTADGFLSLFNSTIKVIYDSLSKDAFRPANSLNAAVFDAVMVGVAKRLEKGKINDLVDLKNKYEKLLKIPGFVEAYKTSTSDENNVKARLTSASEIFSDIP